MNADRSKRWRVAYARQARADLAARDVLLRERNLPKCQQLHFLQMACEKIAKAYLCWRGADPDSLQGSHAYVRGTLPQIVKQHIAKQSRHLQREGSWILASVRVLARQIELLAPAVDNAGRTPANCEYPWEDAVGNVHVPVEHSFELDLLYTPAGTFLLKTLQVFIEQLARDDAH